jgi:hypothetical protein
MSKNMIKIGKDSVYPYDFAIILNPKEYIEVKNNVLNTLVFGFFNGYL